MLAWVHNLQQQQQVEEQERRQQQNISSSSSSSGNGNGDSSSGDSNSDVIIEPPLSLSTPTSTSTISTSPLHPISQALTNALATVKVTSTSPVVGVIIICRFVWSVLLGVRDVSISSIEMERSTASHYTFYNFLYCVFICILQ